MVLSHLLIGFVTSYLGYITPSMLNITASKITLENNIKVARQFVWGATFIVVLQVTIAIFLASHMADFPNIIPYFKKIAIIVFSVLSMVFIYKGVSKTKNTKSKVIKNGFLLGVSLSSINLFAIPFFTGVYISFVKQGWVMPGAFCSLGFGIGAVLGTLVVLSNYIFFTKKFDQRILSYTKYFNLFIGSVIAIVTLFSVIKLYF